MPGRRRMRLQGKKSCARARPLFFLSLRERQFVTDRWHRMHLDSGLERNIHALGSNKSRSGCDAPISWADWTASLLSTNARLLLRGSTRMPRTWMASKRGRIGNAYDQPPRGNDCGSRYKGGG